MPQHKIKGILLSKTPRTMGGKHYEAENLYIKILDNVQYPETQDRDGEICPAGMLPRGKIIEAQQWLKKSDNETLFSEENVNKVHIFSGQIQSYKGKVQYNVWSFETLEEEYENEFLSQSRINATDLLDDDEAKYQAFSIAMKITTVTQASIWKDGARTEVEFPYFQLNGISLDNEAIQVALTYSPAHIGERSTYGLNIPPIAFRDIFEEAQDEEFPMVYIQSMLEDLNIVAGFTLNQVKPYSDIYTLYGNLFSIAEFENVDLISTHVEDYFGEDPNVVDENGDIQTDNQMTEAQFLSDGSIAEVWTFVNDYMKADPKTPLKAELLLKVVKDEGLVWEQLDEILDYFIKTGYLIHVSGKYGLSSVFKKDIDSKKENLMAAFVDDERKNTLAQLAKRADLHKDMAKELLNDLVMDGVIIRPTQGKYKKLDEVETDVQVPKNAELLTAIKTVVETFGTAFDIKQLVEMVKGQYTASTEKEVTLDDSSLTKLILHEQGITKK